MPKYCNSIVVGLSHAEGMDDYSTGKDTFLLLLWYQEVES